MFAKYLDDDQITCTEAILYHLPNGLKQPILCCFKLLVICNVELFLCWDAFLGCI